MADGNAVIKRILRDGKAPANGAEMDAALDAIGVPPLPPELLDKCREMDERELLTLTVDVAITCLMDAMRLASRVQQRCGVCREQGNGEQCAHCTAECLSLQTILTRVAGLSRFTVAAMGPGTRITAQREARAEQSNPCAFPDETCNGNQCKHAIPANG